MRHINRYICLVSLLVTGLTTEAVQLGAAKGSAVFGRPLDLTMQVRLDAPFDEAANCFSVDIFQADNKFDAGRVRLDVTSAANGLDVTIRVRSVSSVNEPWAKVILRSNCGAKVSRQYDFLTDFAADTPASSTLAENAPSQPARATIATTSSSTLTANSQLTSNASNATSATEQAPVSDWSVKRSQGKVKTLQQKSNSEIALAPKKMRPTAPTVVETKKTADIVADAVGRPRLKMETFELTDEHQVLLKLSSALIAPTGMRTPEEIQALAQATAVWRAINGVPAEVKAATVAAAPAPTAALVNQKLAVKSGFPDLVVYGLVGLLAMTLGCIAWLWLRVRKASRAGYGWLNDSVDEDVPVGRKTIQSQFFPTNAQVSAAAIQEPSEPTFEEEKIEEELAEQTIEVEKENEVNIEVELEEKLKTAAAASTDNQIVSALPPHFDAPRFDERVLRSQTKPRDMDLVHEKPITPPAELLASVPADTPPKLRTVPATASSKPVVAKDDSKGNLIDFDVFADPTSAPIDKPSRFVR